ncbi:hypothetical protein EYF80_021755 [Liparis tanakae]|uniref:Uncharacterized protein n=1 Tax=Liparis tanakae TaxID=230148 RepID=A0A4Z2HSK4_9TELE|nr:hypothetical protein EYF80_021755 [Liparis tanakae]
MNLKNGRAVVWPAVESILKVGLSPRDCGRIPSSLLRGPKEEGRRERESWRHQSWAWTPGAVARSQLEPLPARVDNV